MMDSPICINCKEDALSKCYSNEGRREVFISGYCEQCFDKLFDESNFPGPTPEDLE